MSNKSNETTVPETALETPQIKDPYFHLSIPKPLTVLANTGGFVKRHASKAGIFAAGAISATVAILLSNKDDDASDPSVEADTDKLEIEAKSDDDLDLERLTEIVNLPYTDPAPLTTE